MTINSYPIRVAIIGLGKMGTRHLQTLQKMPHLAKLCAIFDIDKAKVIQAERDMPQKIGVENYVDLFDQHPDAVIVATSIENHVVPTIEVLHRGIPVLVEKPLAHSIKGAERILEMARNGTILMVGYTERFNGAICALKEDIEGEPIVAITTRRSGIYSVKQSKSIISTLVTHDIDIIHHLTGADFENIAVETDGKHFFNASFRLTNGVIGNIQADKLSPFKQRVLTVWKKGKFWRADLITQTVQSFRHYRKFGVYTAQVSCRSYIEPLREELEAFLCSVATGTLPPITGEDGLRAIEVAQRCLGGET